MKKALEKILNWIENAVVGFSIVGLMFMVIIVFYQVVARYFFNRPPKWTEEIALVTMIWIAMLGAGIGLKNDIHMRVEVFLSVFPIKLQRIVEIAIMLLIGYFGIQMTRYTITMVQRLPNRLAATGISVAWMYLPIAVCGVLVVACAALKVINQLMMLKGEGKR
ncbi:MAG: TRAP transporter small permease [Thermotoga caldifontis]|uniref:TRAP transporter small permease n=1 Tax=Thermotoga caldifontis TaxID=1508419 RepID=UPI0019CC31C6|nr:TRAP transporter small permease [Pseudothermotoga sp.]